MTMTPTTALPTVDDLTDLAELVLRFSRVERITRHPTGHTDRLETDSDHTVMLTVIACTLAEPLGLDTGLVAQYCTVHDLAEAYAGDTPTLRILSPAERRAKHDRELAGHTRIVERFAHAAPWLARTLAAYECQRDPEARFVWAVDKMLPKLTHLLNGCAGLFEQGVTVAGLVERLRLQADEVADRIPEHPAILDLWARLVAQVVPLYQRAQEHR